MTNEEAIEYNKNLREYMRITDKKSEYKFLNENYKALDMAIKVLEQGNVLDKIRAEIVELQKDYHEYGWAYDDALEIIDKYREVSE